MGQCISRQNEVTLYEENHVAATNARLRCTKGASNSSLRKLEFRRSRTDLDDDHVDKPNSKDSINKKVSKKLRKRNCGGGVVIIPEVKDETSRLEEDGIVNESVGEILNDFTSPAVTSSTLYTTASFSGGSSPGSSRTKSVSCVENSTSHDLQSNGSNPFQTENSELGTKHSTSFVATKFQSENGMNAVASIEGTQVVRQKNSLQRRNQIHNQKIVMKDFQHPDSALLEDTVNLLPANFTPIKQTSLQTRVSVIKEEEDLEAPTDEESHEGDMVRRNHRDRSSKSRVTGPLTPIKLRTQWKASPASIQVREQVIIQNSTSNPATRSPLRNGSIILPKTRDVDSNIAVEDAMLNNFRKLKLQVAVAEQQSKKNVKVAKIEDRLKDVQGYKELWGDFQQIQIQVNKVETAIGTENDLDILEPPTNVVEYDLEDDHDLLVARRHRVSYRSKRTADKGLETQPNESASPSLSGLKDTSVWIFDFQAEGFQMNCEDQNDDRSQSSMSLLSESSMEAQRRFFAQKRKESKQKKKRQKNTSSSRSSPLLVDATPSGSSKINFNDSYSASSSFSDYGPTHRLRRTISGNRSISGGCNEKAVSVITDMEVAFQSLNATHKARVGSDADSCSWISDLADDQSYAASVASSHYSSTYCSAGLVNNDYRVNKKRYQQNLHKVDMENSVSNTGSIGSITCSVAERRRAVEARLQLLNKQDTVTCGQEATTPSQLTKRFDAVVTPSPPNNGHIPSKLLLSNVDSAVKGVGKEKEESLVDVSVGNGRILSVEGMKSLELSLIAGKQSHTISPESTSANGGQSPSPMETGSLDETMENALVYKNAGLFTNSSLLNKIKTDEAERVTVPDSKCYNELRRIEDSESSVRKPAEMLNPRIAVGSMDHETFMSQDKLEDSIKSSNIHGSQCPMKSEFFFESFQSCNDDPYRRFSKNNPNLSKHASHGTESKDAKVCQGTIASELLMTSRENDENCKHVIITISDCEAQEARKSLQLADNVAARVQDVLEKFRSTMD